jgi:hypothetical protein
MRLNLNKALLQKIINAAAGKLASNDVLEITLEVCILKSKKLVEQLVKWQCLILEQEKSRLNIKRTLDY